MCLHPDHYLLHPRCVSPLIQLLGERLQGRKDWTQALVPVEQAFCCRAASQPCSVYPSIHLSICLSIHPSVHPSVRSSITFYEALLLRYKNLSYRKIWSNQFLAKLSILSLSCRMLHPHSTLFAWTVFELSFKVRYKYWNSYADTLKQHVCPI